MTWTITNLVIQAIAGLIGGHTAAIVVPEHNFGKIGHTVTGLIGGVLSGYFLQTAVGTIADGPNLMNASNDPVFQSILQVLAGFVAGAIVTFFVGFLKPNLEHHRSKKP